jgi:cytochrome P450
MITFEAGDGSKLTDLHVRTLSVNSIAGSLSLTYMLGNLLYRYLSDEEDFTSVLRADPSLIPLAVEESLRYEPPVLFLFRTAKDDIEVGGCPIRKGERVILGALPYEHVSFGEGPHLCLGNHLTRMIGRVVLEEMLDAFAPGEIALAPSFEYRLVPMFLEYGPESLEAVVVKS